MLLKDALDYEFYVGDRLFRVEPVFAAFTKALLMLDTEAQRECFERLVAEGKASKRTLADRSTEYCLHPPLVQIASNVPTFDDGIHPMQWVTND